MNDPLQSLRREVGTLRHSDWLLIDQHMIDQFADATLDRQYIHVDPIRAAATPFGGTIAHGFLTLSLIAYLQESINAGFMPDIKMAINYGSDRVRFITPVRSGSHVRLASTLAELTERSKDQILLRHDIAAEIQGEERPALVASWLALIML